MICPDAGVKLLQRAAQATLEVIDWLEKKVPPTLRRLLKKIREHLFDPGYDLSKLGDSLRMSSTWLILTTGPASLCEV